MTYPPNDPSQQQPGWPPHPPPGQPPYPGQPGWGPPQQPRRNWFARHKVLTGILGIVALFIIIGIAAGASGGGKTQSSGTSAAGSPSPETATASVAPQATTATSAPAPSPSLPPSPTQAAPKPSAHTVATFSGSGQQNTPKFTVSDTWRLKYSFDCSSFGSSGNFQVYEDGGNDFALSVNDLASSKSSSTYAYNDAGTHYLQINSECSWTVSVIDEPGQ